MFSLAGARKDPRTVTKSFLQCLCKQIKTMPASINYRQCLPQSRPLHIKDFSKRITGSKMHKQVRLGARRKTVPTTLWPREIRSTYLLVLSLHKSGETLVEPPACGPTPAPSRLPFGLKAGNTGSSARKFC